MDDGVLTLSVAGELDVTSSWQLRRRLLEGTSGCRSAVLNLAHVTFIDSAAVGLLVGLAEELRRRSVGLVLQAPSPPVRRVMLLTGLADTPFMLD